MNESELLEVSKKIAESKGVSLNPDEKVVDGIIKGLLANEKKYKYRFCPCRVVSGNFDEDKDKICPCVWMIDEIAKDGRCHCGLFVKKQD